MLMRKAAMRWRKNICAPLVTLSKKGTLPFVFEHNNGIGSIALQYTIIPPTAAMAGAPSCMVELTGSV